MTQKIVCCITEMPDKVSRLVSFGLRVSINQLWDRDGALSDDVEIIILGNAEQVENGLKHLPMWYPNHFGVVYRLSQREHDYGFFPNYPSALQAKEYVEGLLLAGEIRYPGELVITEITLGKITT